MRCKHCDNEIKEDAKVCPSCGAHNSEQKKSPSSYNSNEEPKEQTKKLAEIMQSFYLEKFESEDIFCRNCGEKITNRKKCTKCGENPIRGKHEYCSCCGGVFYGPVCLFCHSPKSEPPAELFLRLFTLFSAFTSFMIGLCFILSNSLFLGLTLILTAVPVFIFTTVKSLRLRANKAWRKKNGKVRTMSVLYIITCIILIALFTASVLLHGLTAKKNYEKDLVGAWVISSDNPENISGYDCDIKYIIFEHKDDSFSGKLIRDYYNPFFTFLPVFPEENSHTFTKYTATKDTVTLYMSDGSIEKYTYSLKDKNGKIKSYKDVDAYLYLNGVKFERIR